MNIYVYVVTRGERYEGAHTVAITFHYEKAREIAMKQEAYFDDEKWHPVVLAKKGNAKNDVVSLWLWENGCDYVRIEQRMVVQ